MKIKHIAWPTTKEESDHMAIRQKQNRESCKLSAAEEWMKVRLRGTGMKWKRQSRWGIRLFDFWNSEKGIAVEVDGPEHDPIRDKAKDRVDFLVSGILVLRVKNFDELDAQIAISRIMTSQSWNSRRSGMGLKPLTTYTKRASIK
mgnify:CR=1 FL=1